MGLAATASQCTLGSSVLRLGNDCSRLPLPRRQNALVRVNSASTGASLSSGRIVLAAERAQQQSVRPGASSGNGSGAAPEARPRSAPSTNGVATAAAVATVLPSTQPAAPATALPPVMAPVPAARPMKQQPAFTPVPEDVIAEFEHKLEADLQTVGVTLTAVLGVIIFWRGVWALLDHFIGDSVVGDLACIFVGLSIVLYIRLSGMKIASFWPPS